MKKRRLLLTLTTLLVLTGLPGQTGATTLTTLYSFIGGSDGAEPPSALVQGGDSNLYGVTYGGGVRRGHSIPNKRGGDIHNTV